VAFALSAGRETSSTGDDRGELEGAVADFDNHNHDHVDANAESDKRSGHGQRGSQTSLGLENAGRRSPASAEDDAEFPPGYG
jgi:hypothetical protein